LRRLGVASAHLRNNPDGDAILWSFDRLRQSRAKRKLLIVASDGSPACDRGGDIDWYTREVVKKIENETPIQIVGIGIMDNNVTRIYKEHYVIHDAAELEKALLTLIDKKVR
jgi:cobaltochelatase CobT